MVRGYMVRGLEGYMVRGLGMAYSCHSDAIVMPYSLVWQSYGKAMGSAWQGAGVAECDKIYMVYIIYRNSVKGGFWYLSIICVWA